MSKQSRRGLIFSLMTSVAALAPAAMAQPIQNVQAPYLAVAPERAAGLPATQASPSGARRLAGDYDAPAAKVVLTVDPASRANVIEKVRKRSGSKKPVARTAGVAAPAAPGREAPPASAPPDPTPELAAMPAAPQERKVRVIPLYAVPADNQR